MCKYCCWQAAWPYSKRWEEPDAHPEHSASSRMMLMRDC